MALLAQDVTDLKCIYFKNVSLLVDVVNFGVDCNKDIFQELVDTIYEYLTLLEASDTICRTLECKILDIIENNTYTTPCATRNVFTLIPDVN